MSGYYFWEPIFLGGYQPYKLAEGWGAKCSSYFYPPSGDFKRSRRTDDFPSQKNLSYFLHFQWAFPKPLTPLHSVAGGRGRGEIRRFRGWIPCAPSQATGTPLMFTLQSKGAVASLLQVAVLQGMICPGPCSVVEIDHFKSFLSTSQDHGDLSTTGHPSSDPPTGHNYRLTPYSYHSVLQIYILSSHFEIILSWWVERQRLQSSLLVIHLALLTPQHFSTLILHHPSLLCPQRWHSHTEACFSDGVLHPQRLCGTEEEGEQGRCTQRKEERRIYLPLKFSGSCLGKFLLGVDLF